MKLYSTRNNSFHFPFLVEIRVKNLAWLFSSRTILIFDFTNRAKLIINKYYNQTWIRYSCCWEKVIIIKSWISIIDEIHRKPDTLPLNNSLLLLFWLNHYCRWSSSGAVLSVRVLQDEAVSTQGEGGREGSCWWVWFQQLRKTEKVYLGTVWGTEQI